MKQKRTHQETAGLTKAPSDGSSFADVGRACHRWLMQHDHVYSRNVRAFHARKDEARNRALANRPI